MDVPAGPNNPYANLPVNARIHLQDHVIEASEESLEEWRMLTMYGRIGPVTYENVKGEDYGITRDWLKAAQYHWLTRHDWRKTEARINSNPNCFAHIEHDGDDYNIHFTGLLSKKSDAVPVVLLHGWPGSFLEFLPVLELLKKKYTPEALPYHVIVPSLPGFGYSSGPPLRLDKDFTVEAMSAIVDKLMIALGFETGYIAQGGDLGSFIARILGVTSKSCKAVHLNLMFDLNPADVPDSELSDIEIAGLARGQKAKLGRSYAVQQGNRPATIGLILSTNPLALLAWVGEKFLTWVDAPLALDDILDSATLYWITDTYPRSIPFYRQIWGPVPSKYYHPDPAYRLTVPTGYSYFPKEISPTPVKRAAENANLVWTRIHTKGGHFAALEVPQDFLDDVEDFVAKVWPTVQ